MTMRRDTGMAGYVTDNEVQRWRHRKEVRPKHPLRYDPPRYGDTLKTIAGLIVGGIAAWLVTELWWVAWSATQPYMW